MDMFFGNEETNNCKNSKNSGKLNSKRIEFLGTEINSNFQKQMKSPKDDNLDDFQLEYGEV